MCLLSVRQFAKICGTGLNTQPHFCNYNNQKQGHLKGYSTNLVMHSLKKKMADITRLWNHVSHENPSFQDAYVFVSQQQQNGPINLGVCDSLALQVSDGHFDFKISMKNIANLESKMPKEIRHATNVPCRPQTGDIKSRIHICTYSIGVHNVFIIIYYHIYYIQHYKQDFCHINCWTKSHRWISQNLSR